MRAAKVQVSLRICAVSPEPPLLAHTSSESRGTFRQKARSLAPLNGWACAVDICHDGMLEDTNSLDAAQLLVIQKVKILVSYFAGVHLDKHNCLYLQTDTRLRRASWPSAVGLSSHQNVPSPLTIYLVILAGTHVILAAVQTSVEFSGYSSVHQEPTEKI